MVGKWFIPIVASSSTKKPTKRLKLIAWEFSKTQNPNGIHPKHGPGSHFFDFRTSKLVIHKVSSKNFIHVDFLIFHQGA